MKPGYLYRALLQLYPADFRNQFAEEMISVFEQKSHERLENRKLTWLVSELFSIVKGAHMMWLTKILSIDREPSSPGTALPAETPLTPAEISRRRHAVINDMCASIANHDFINARHYAHEETRLSHLLEKMERAESRTA
jgi:hypothetical protein